jgi:hypothetical protein
VSHNAQSRLRGVHFGDRARGAKIGPAEEGVLRWRLSWVLGALEPKKGLKRPRRAGLGVVERVPKTAPKGAVFCHLFTGTETYADIPAEICEYLRSVLQTATSRNSQGA